MGPHPPLEVLVITNGVPSLRVVVHRLPGRLSLTFLVTPSPFSDEAIRGAYGSPPICHVPKLRKAAMGAEVSLTAPFPHEPPILRHSPLSTSAANPSCADRGIGRPNAILNFSRRQSFLVVQRPRLILLKAG
jgi:hypothetical protein